MGFRKSFGVRKTFVIFAARSVAILTPMNSSVPPTFQQDPRMPEALPEIDQRAADTGVEIDELAGDMAYGGDRLDEGGCLLGVPAVARPDVDAEDEVGGLFLDHVQLWRSARRLADTAARRGAPGHRNALRTVHV